jgi:accessory gene regulator B
MNSLIEYTAERIALKLKSINPEETASVEVMKYALYGIIHNLLVIITSLLIGIILGNLIDTLIASFSFMALRLFSGGLHFKSSLVCLIFSTFTLVFSTLFVLPMVYLYVINSISLLLVFIYAPSNIKEHLRVSERMYPLFKAISIFIVLTNFLWMNPVVGWTFLIQSLALIHIKEKGGGEV